MQSLQQASAASDRVFEMLEEKELEDESQKTVKLENVKGDVEFKNVKFSYDEGKEIAEKYNAISFFETSAKSNINVEDAFRMLITKLIEYNDINNQSGNDSNSKKCVLL